MKNHNQFDYQAQRSGAEKERANSTNFKLLLLVSCLVLLVLGGVFLQIYQYVRLSEKNLEIEELKEKRNQLKTEAAHLRLEASRLVALDRIEERAIENLGMEAPTEINYIALSEQEEIESFAEEVINNSTEQEKTWFDQVSDWLGF